jgi:hypothetical protein
VSTRLGTALGAGAGMVFALAVVLTAATAGFEQPQATTLTIALVGVIFLGIAVVLAVAAYISPFFPSLGYGFCWVAVPASLLAALICAFTGYLEAAAGLAVWAVELAGCYVILRAIAPRMSRGDEAAGSSAGHDKSL